MYVRFNCSLLLVKVLLLRTAIQLLVNLKPSALNFLLKTFFYGLDKFFKVHGSV